MTQMTQMAQMLIFYSVICVISAISGSLIVFQIICVIRAICGSIKSSFACVEPAEDRFRGSFFVHALQADFMAGLDVGVAQVRVS